MDVAGTWGPSVTVGFVTPSAETPNDAEVPSEEPSSPPTLDVRGSAAPLGGSREQLECGNHILVPGQGVTILSENYPEKYPTNRICKWNFQASSPKSRITILCSDFDMEDCSLSSLRIRSQGLSIRYCNFQKNMTITSANDFMKVVFKTRGSSATRRGFNCTVSATDVVVVSKRSNCRCGQVNRVSKIVGGVVTELHEYPWQVAITPLGLSRPFCGGSIISDRYVLTAAHCVAGKTPVNVRVTVGEHDWQDDSETPFTKSLLVDEGDSGGPLVTDGGSDSPYEYMVQIGIVSWGIICGFPGQPAVFARVNNYLDWIEENTADSTFCPSPNQSSNESLAQH
ncbi:venom serine protease 34-like [Macrobrachium rosenbergii]|uniref:venom serine protease 34-like n=1 Tax=Macrobrachium rosenbergii TaxID=79674 RepID=UPI0034D65B41